MEHPHIFLKPNEVEELLGFKCPKCKSLLNITGKSFKIVRASGHMNNDKEWIKITEKRREIRILKKSRSEEVREMARKAGRLMPKKSDRWIAYDQARTRLSKKR